MCCTSLLLGGQSHAGVSASSLPPARLDMSGEGQDGSPVERRAGSSDEQTPLPSRPRPRFRNSSSGELLSTITALPQYRTLNGEQHATLLRLRDVALFDREHTLDGSWVNENIDGWNV